MGALLLSELGELFAKSIYLCRCKRHKVGAVLHCLLTKPLKSSLVMLSISENVELNFEIW